MQPAREHVKEIARGGNVFSVTVVHDQNRWLWSVALTSAVLRDRAYWGRLLGCGQAADQQDAWQRAQQLIDRGRGDNIADLRLAATQGHRRGVQRPA